MSEWKRDPHAYEPDGHRCPGCEQLEQARDQVPEGQRGVKVYLVPSEED